MTLKPLIYARFDVFLDGVKYQGLRLCSKVAMSTNNSRPGTQLAIGSDGSRMQ